ncbi:hypothetical protein D3C75_1054140 [compost metagenome]
MNKLMKRIVLVTLAGVMSTAVQAANLNIDGIVVASPCIVDTGSVSQEVDFRQLPNGGGMTVNIDAQRNATYALVGRMNSPMGNAGPGTINSIVQMNFTYQ